jgi:hypothetical protein
MATASMKTITTHTVTLELSHDEARFLRAITNLISGSPDNSRRKFADSIEQALEKASVKYSTDDLSGCIDVISR